MRTPFFHFNMLTVLLRLRLGHKHYLLFLIKYLLILCHEFRSWTQFGFRGIFPRRLFYIVFIKILKFNFKVFFHSRRGFGCQPKCTGTARSRIKEGFFCFFLVRSTNGEYSFMGFHVSNFVSNGCGRWMAASNQQNLHECARRSNSTDNAKCEA